MNEHSFYYSSSRAPKAEVRDPFFSLVPFPVAGQTIDCRVCPPRPPSMTCNHFILWLQPCFACMFGLLLLPFPQLCSSYIGSAVPLFLTVNRSIHNTSSTTSLSCVRVLLAFLQQQQKSPAHKSGQGAFAVDRAHDEMSPAAHHRRNCSAPPLPRSIHQTITRGGQTSFLRPWPPTDSAPHFPLAEKIGTPDRSSASQPALVFFLLLPTFLPYTSSNVGHALLLIPPLPTPA